MAKVKLPDPTDTQPKAKKQETETVLMFVKAEGAAYGLVEIEIDKDLLMKNGRVVSKTNPDIFAIFITHLTKKARDLFGI